MNMVSAIIFEPLGKGTDDCGFILAGLDGTEGASICKKIEEALIRGNMGIDIKNEQISFMVEGVSCMFLADEERLLAINKMLEAGRVQREPYADANYQGFKLTKNL
jgi:hypothetical protein